MNNHQTLNKMKQTDISEMFKITPQNILAIKKGKTWTNV